MAKRLTAAMLGRLKAASKGKREQHSDSEAPGLVVRVTDTGKKSLAVLYRMPGEGATKAPRRLTLDDLQIIDEPTKWGAEADRIRAANGETLSLARTAAREARAQAAAGIDPAQARRDAREAQRLARETEKQRQERETFGAIVEEYIRLECGERQTIEGRERWVPRKVDGEREAKQLRRDFADLWERHFGQIKRADLTRAVEEVQDKIGPGAAFKLGTFAVRLGNWMVEREHVDVSPFAGWRKPTDIKPRRGSRVLRDNELRTLWPAIGALGYPFGPWTKLLLLTLQRRTEVATMEWSELDLDARIWFIPPEKHKAGEAPFAVPLCRTAVDILETLPRFDSGPYVFSTTDGKRPISGFSKVKARVDKAAPLTESWTFHDLRRTGRTNLPRVGVRDEVAERCINHVPDSYLPEKRQALDRWNRFLCDFALKPEEKRPAFETWLNDLVAPSAPVENVEQGKIAVLAERSRS